MKINFKKFLESKCIDTRLFWENCKRKNQGFDYENLHKRKDLVKEEPRRWLVDAFYWEESLEDIEHNIWAYINECWISLVESTESKNIKFGF